MAKIKPAGDALRGVGEDHCYVDRKRADHPVQVIGGVLEINGIDIDRDRPRGVLRQRGTQFDVRRMEYASPYDCWA